MEKLSGEKIGMTHIFSEEGRRHPVTVIEIVPSGKQQLQQEREPAKGTGQEPLREQGQEQAETPEKKEEQQPRQNQEQKEEISGFKSGDFVDITSISKGKGFQGGMKRWNWSGTPKTRGSMSHRRAGSIGASADPSRVLKGKHMPGHMGNKTVTVQNLRIIKLDKQHNLLAVEGAVPGHRNSKVIIKKAKKK